MFVMEKKDKSKEDKIYKRHIRFWKIAKIIIGPFLKVIYRFSYEIAPKIDGAYLVLSNHNTDLDPALVALSFPRQM
jgi:1-acyl-sn-glycerol-3-phosphate acyltransferase